jgi:hypothetical protein
MTEPTENWFVAPDEVREIVRAGLRAFADEVLAEAIGTSIGEIAKEIEAHLRDALREFTYKGSWSEGVTYRKGNFVSMGGQLYHANHDGTSRPGTNGDWSLAVKSGRDGRDGKDAAGASQPSAARAVRSYR